MFPVSSLGRDRLLPYPWLDSETDIQHSTPYLVGLFRDHLFGLYIIKVAKTPLKDIEYNDTNPNTEMAIIQE